MIYRIVHRLYCIAYPNLYPPTPNFNECLWTGQIWMLANPFGRWSPHFPIDTHEPFAGAESGRFRRSRGVSYVGIWSISDRTWSSKARRRKWLGFNDYQLDGTWSGGSKRVTFFNQKTERDLKNPTKKAKPTVFFAEVSVLRVFFWGYRESCDFLYLGPYAW